MALTYATLQSTVQSYLDRSDLDSLVPTFIEMAEAKMKRTLRHHKMEKRATANTTAGTRTLSLPSDFLEMRSVKRNSTYWVPLESLPPQVLNAYAGVQGVPKYFALVGDELHLDPIPDSVYEIEMWYFAFAVLSDSNTSNWLLETYPDMYIYGTLLEAEAYLMNDPRLPIWKQAFDEAMKQLNREARITRWGGAPLTIRPS